MMNAFERDALYGVKVPDRRLALRIDYAALELRMLRLAQALRPAVEKCVESMLAFGKTLAGLKATARARYNARLRKRPLRHRPRRINGRLRPLTSQERRKKERRRERVQDRSGSPH